MQNRSSGGSRQSMNNSIPPRGALVDPQTYGMLLWQSKLQEKLLQEQKQKRQKEQEDQQRRIRERRGQPPPPPSSQQVRSERIQSQNAPSSANREDTTPILEIPPQMFPGPAPYTFQPHALLSPPAPQQTDSAGTTSPPGNLPNGPTTATAVSSPGGLEQQPMFPEIANRIRTSVSCDNFRKAPQPAPPTRLLGNIVSFHQMGGAGSPRRTPSGKLLTSLRGDPEIRYHQKDTRGFDQTMRYLIDRDKVQEYKRELDQQLEEKRRWRSRLGSGAIKEITRKGFIENGGDKTHTTSVSSDQLDYGHQQQHHPYGSSFYPAERESGVDGRRGSRNGMELAPLMRKFNSLPKLTGLSSTDVTRPFVHSPRNEFFHLIQPTEVAESLSTQLREKEWLSRRHQENERVATERHFQTWDSLWGRPGGGAPLACSQKTLGHAVSFGSLASQEQRSSNSNFNRVNLFKALHMTHQLPSRPK